LEYFMDIWDILWPFGDILCSFGTFFQFWYHASRKFWQPCLDSKPWKGGTQIHRFKMGKGREREKKYQSGSNLVQSISSCEAITPTGEDSNCRWQSCPQVDKIVIGKKCDLRKCSL
jgi:hypothetical protein